MSKIQNRKVLGIGNVKLVNLQTGWSTWEQWKEGLLLKTNKKSKEIRWSWT